MLDEPMPHNYTSCLAAYFTAQGTANAFTDYYSAVLCLQLTCSVFIFCFVFK